MEMGRAHGAAYRQGEEKLNKIPEFKVIILDFDGVIVESNRIKHRAFSEIFEEYPEHYDELMEYHLGHNHVCRQDKFKHICGNILKGKCRPGDAERMVERFGELTTRKIIECPYVTGALDFLENYRGRYPLYLASATPDKELGIILEKRGLKRYFTGVYGAPTPKTEMFSDIIKKENIASGDVLFIGDSVEDCNSAKEAGVQFLARNSDFDFSKLGVRCFDDLTRLMRFLENKL